MSNDVLDVSKILSEEDLKYYDQLAKNSDDVSPGRAPILKIQYDEESKYPKGCWVVGQLKDQAGKIIDQGKKVTSLVVLKVRNLYSYWDQEDTSKNCKSPIHKDMEKVKGNNYKYQCGNTCPFKAEKKCKAMKVVFGVAITENNETIDCVSYMKGVNYMPFSTYLKEATSLEVNGKTYMIPVYSFITGLDSEKGTNGSVKYYTAVFKRVQVMKTAATDKLKAKAEQLEKDLDKIDTSSVERDNEKDESVTPTAVVHEDIFEKKGEKKDVIETTAQNPEKPYEDLFK
jgi:hypothetical protein